MHRQRRRLRMRMVLPILAFMVAACPANAFQCPQDHSLETAFHEAERAFLIYVLEARLEEELTQELLEQHPEDEGEEFIKLVSAGYRVVESYKGPEDYQPRLLELLGIGTGYVGLTPGIYYLVLLPTPEESEDPQLRRVDMCTVPISHYRLQVDELQDELDRVRSLAGRMNEE